MTEISITKWYEATNPQLSDSVKSIEITKLAERGELVVVDNEGKRFKPQAFGESWKLEPCEQ